jgi:hypothetical protein
MNFGLIVRDNQRVPLSLNRLRTNAWACLGNYSVYYQLTELHQGQAYLAEISESIHTTLWRKAGLAADDNTTVLWEGL